ncbi:MAG: magnesium transporter [Elusimicrobia bacterium]|nr:magnesium transporter [Elusimicrobiota bacterium]
MKTLQLYLSDLKELLGGKEFASARTCLREVGAIDLADGWDRFSPDERRVIFRLLTRHKAYQLFEELEPEFQKELLESLGREHVEELLQGLEPSAVGRVARDLPQSMVRHLKTVMNRARYESVQKYLQYPPQSVGALMRGRYMTVEARWTTKQAMERIQLGTRLRHIAEIHLDTLMVADEEGRLKGTVSLKQLVVAPNNMTVADLMDDQPRTLHPEMDQEEAVKLFSKYKLKHAPVVTPDGQLLGIVVYGDIFEIASEETEEDFAKMAGMGRNDLAMGVLQQVRLRLPWLIITCLGGMLVSTVIRGFEGTIAKIIALASFSPLIAGMGGNVGSQTATLVVRGLATGEIKDEDAGQAVRREVLVGLTMGLLYGVATGLIAYAFYGERYTWRFSLVVGLGMAFSMTVSSLLASLEPFIFRRLGVDPATATGPLITTTTDLLSNILYLGLATYLLL